MVLFTWPFCMELSVHLRKQTTPYKVAFVPQIACGLYRVGSISYAAIANKLILCFTRKIYRAIKLMLDYDRYMQKQLFCAL